ncbi:MULTISPECIES: GNAT family N-acetyltransferase [Methylorubrum]|uniref:GNAT family N-acetyltransferase n=1 Tax=Methylorubrum TaxID=2282523 RepID=UPI0020A08520|nr:MULTISPECIES: GNAT family N-acetyltransferase [Methylorubrum]MCP1538044.1 ribosomal protein S18 acetylase RimI-like enzyme [Methylorubrum extorquens]MCY1643336.1 GNAT family N-acetyltransferase [Methylorubrum sp. SL192]
MTISIRDAVDDDIPAIFEVRTSVRENHLSVGQMAEIGVTFGTIREALCEHPCIWVAELEGQIVGFSMVDVEDACIFAAFVRPEREGVGIGRQLVERAEAFLFERHASIWLETDGSSRAAGIYERLGWKRSEELENGDARFEKHRPRRSD